MVFPGSFDTANQDGDKLVSFLVIGYRVLDIHFFICPLDIGCWLLDIYFFKNVAIAISSERPPEPREIRAQKALCLFCGMAVLQKIADAFS